MKSFLISFFRPGPAGFSQCRRATTSWHIRCSLALHAIAIAFLLLFTPPVHGQLKKPLLADSLFSTYYHQRVAHFRTLPQTKGDIIFLGNSITDGSEWSELFNDLRMKNRGISGDVSAGVIHRIDEILLRRPAKVFLLIGTNDLARGISQDSLLKNILWIADYLRQESPELKLYVQSILPVNNSFGRFSGHTGKGAAIRQVNARLQSEAAKHQYRFIDLHPFFADDSGKLKAAYTNDGLHLTGAAYQVWKHALYPYVYDAQLRPSLIPQPQSLKWKKDPFPLYACKTIVVEDSSLHREAGWLKKQLGEKGWIMHVKTKPSGKEPYIRLGLAKPALRQSEEEAYELNVDADRVSLIANTAHGIFNGLQTLLQLPRDGGLMDGCAIMDWPAFSWRGYMIDVGRNYMSMDLLKQQIEVMSRYKLNVFHFHFTEDIAWRLASRQYPQLTDPQFMLRDKGQYYTEAEMKELIAFCKERYITLVPEIDMPGHSAAFRRAMGFDMQSDSGLAAVKNIIREFIQTYDLPYFHIGADEVKITNEKFVPEITAYIQGFGKEVIGWQPGGNFTDNTIRQLWMDDNGRITGNANIRYIDSRHLYLNHFDPLESVVTIFHRRIAEKEKGDKAALGATLCMWHDRAVAKEDDILKMNPVYPGMLAFAERTWKGGGYPGWTAAIGAPSSAQAREFREFEQRLLDHKQQYFSALPFPYVEQSSTVWDFYGPYANAGNLSAKFEPETRGMNARKIDPAFSIAGGTIILRHWWYPKISGVIAQPEDSTTWYAATRIWSDADTEKEFWIDFNNLSRSPATDSPPVGAWDERKSAVWVNGSQIAAPAWKRGGQKGNSEIPLTDEGYAYRAPAKIRLRQGWNDVLVKLPVASFKGTSWQNPVKWMFTFVPVTN